MARRQKPHPHIPGRLFALLGACFAAIEKARAGSAIGRRTRVSTIADPLRSVLAACPEHRASTCGFRFVHIASIRHASRCRVLREMVIDK